MLHTERTLMQAQFSNIYIANPVDILQELDINQFDLIYLDPPFYESNIFKKGDIGIPYQNFEEYLEYIVGIIFQAHRVLKDSGSILLRISPLSLFNARLFLDRIFGKQNFRAEIIWPRRIVGRSETSTPRANFESVFFYSKTENFIYNEPLEELSSEEIKKQYSHNDEKGYYKLWPLTDKVSRTERSFEWNGYKPPKGNTWKYTKTRLIELKNAGEIEFTGKMPRRKIYLTSERALSPLGFVWNYFPQTTMNNQLDERIQKAVEMTSSSNAFILSIFTDLITLNTVEKSNTELGSNRQWTGITPFNIAESLRHDIIEASETTMYGAPRSSNPLTPSYLLDSRINVVDQTYKEKIVNRGEIPIRIRNLINAEAQSIAPNTLPISVGQKYAFLVGINRYTPGIGDLGYCVNDAIELGQVFQNIGYQAKVLHDESEDGNLYPNKSNIETELSDWVQSLSQEDTLYVHFSCHGTIAGENAMVITSDTRRQRLAQTALDLRDIIAIMKSGRAKKLVLSLDVCHGGAEMGRALVDQEFVQNVYKKAEGFVLLAASTALQQAYETHEHKHGLFTYFLIQGLSGKADFNEDGIISVNDLKNYTLDQVRRWNAQNGGTQEPTYKAEGIGDIPLIIQ